METKKYDYERMWTALEKMLTEKRDDCKEDAEKFFFETYFPSAALDRMTSVYVYETALQEMWKIKELCCYERDIASKVSTGGEVVRMPNDDIGIVYDDSGSFLEPRKPKKPSQSKKRE